MLGLRRGAAPGIALAAALGVEATLDVKSNNCAAPSAWGCAWLLHLEGTPWAVQGDVLGDKLEAALAIALVTTVTALVTALGPVLGIVPTA